MRIRIRYVLLIVGIWLSITACTSHDSFSQPFGQQSAKNPQRITLYDDHHLPQTSYRVIGTASISRYNLFGMQRNDATLQQMIKALAAAKGGDGLIDLEHESHQIKGNIIAYQPVLF